MRFFRLSCFALLAGVIPVTALAQAGAAAPAEPTGPVEGVWQTAERSELTIAPCEGGYCGYITKIVVPEHIAAAYGEDLLALEGAFTDMNNKDPALRDRPIQGLQILTMRPGPDAWRLEGNIYNPQDGNVYSGSVEILGPDSLRLQGCVLYVLCQEQQWQRVQASDEAESES